MSSGTIGDFLTGVAGSNSDTWAVGTNGAIWRFNGTAFVRSSSGTLSNLNAAWSSGPSELWTVGDSGVILHHEP